MTGGRWEGGVQLGEKQDGGSNQEVFLLPALGAPGPATTDGHGHCNCSTLCIKAKP